jgi:hypothetical protein
MRPTGSPTGSRRAVAVVLVACVVLGVTVATTSRLDDGHLAWRVVASESFDDPLPVDRTGWTRDPGGEDSPWHVDDLDDDGRVWRAISGPAFDRALDTFDVYRKRVPFGDGGWLTAEVAAQDKDLDGRPDSQPGLRRTTVDGEPAGLLHEPSWDAGVLIRPTRPLPARYRVEVTLRAVDFGGRRHGRLRYDGKVNGYRPRPCVTAYPWTFTGAAPRRRRCDYPDVTDQNGFYFLGILDYATPAPHGNPGIHQHRKVVMDGYNSVAPWSRRYGVCDPATKRVVSVRRSNLTAVNALFIRGDRFRKANNDVSNEYFYKTACGDYSGDGAWGAGGRLHDILSAAELQPELMPPASYSFAVERSDNGYTMEMSGPFRHTEGVTLRAHHDFVEDGRPIWHYNRTAAEYDGRFDRSLTYRGPAGRYVDHHVWPAGSSYPDSFVIGDPHLNFYEGSAVVDDIRLLVPR